MMSENLLSVFKKELGYVNATNQYVELSIRITEKEHSINKLQDDIKAAKWLSVFLPKKKRQQIKELETSLANMIHLIESFNKYFSDAGWCAYDSMNMPLMENAVKAYEAGGIGWMEHPLISRHYSLSFINYKNFHKTTYPN